MKPSKCAVLRAFGAVASTVLRLFAVLTLVHNILLASKRNQSIGQDGRANLVLLIIFFSCLSAHFALVFFVYFSVPSGFRYLWHVFLAGFRLVALPAKHSQVLRVVLAAEYPRHDMVELEQVSATPTVTKLLAYELDCRSPVYVVFFHPALDHQLKVDPALLATPLCAFPNFTPSLG